MTTVNWPDVLNRLVRGQDLDDTTASAVMSSIMAGEATPVQIAGFLMSLRAKGETVSEIAGLVRGMREFALHVDVDGPVVDTCGTGGDRAGTFNVSTVSAVVAAAAGATRGQARQPRGERALRVGRSARGVGCRHRPAARRGAARASPRSASGSASPRRSTRRCATPSRSAVSWACPTVFNFLGPLTNPAGARHQTIGVSDPGMAPKMAEVLARVGTDARVRVPRRRRARRADHHRDPRRCGRSATAP